MRKQSIIASALLSSSLILAALPVGAVSYAGTWSVSRNNTVGTSYYNLTSSSSTHCVLSKVGVVETDTGSELAQCRLLRGPLVWTLEAILGTSSDADVYCSATCFYN